MLHLEELEPIAPTPDSYIDYSVTNSILSGLILAVLAGWAMVMFNRLWQHTLRRDAAVALEHAIARGLTVFPDGLMARIVAEGAIGSELVRLEWRGGWRGAHTVMWRGDRFHRLPLVTSTAELDGALQSSDTSS
jgi:hypothetical protein